MNASGFVRVRVVAPSADYPAGIWLCRGEVRSATDCDWNICFAETLASVVSEDEGNGIVAGVAELFPGATCQPATFADWVENGGPHRQTFKFQT